MHAMTQRIPKEEKKFSISFSLNERQMRALSYCPGDTPSERLQYVLDELDKKNRTLVLYEKNHIAIERYEPIFVAEGAFLFYLQTDTSYEFGNKVPEELSLQAKMAPELMKQFILDRGYECNLVSFDELNFIAIWVRKNTKEKIPLREEIRNLLHRVERLVDELHTKTDADTI
jgi:hypothetical protein